VSRVTNCVTVPNFIEIAQTVAEICKFQYYASLALKCLFTPPFYEVLGAHFPQMMSLIDRPGQDRTKVTKGLYFTYLWRSPYWCNVHEHLFSGWKWNFRGLRFYRGSNFPFSYWFLNGPYNSAALLQCSATALLVIQL